jgi:hypothetical protein
MVEVKLHKNFIFLQTGIKTDLTQIGAVSKSSLQNIIGMCASIHSLFTICGMNHRRQIYNLGAR